MIYINADRIKGAKLAIKSEPSAIEKAYIEGWNDCIEALLVTAPTDDDLDIADNPEDDYCEECSFSGLLTED